MCARDAAIFRSLIQIHFLSAISLDGGGIYLLNAVISARWAELISQAPVKISSGLYHVSDTDLCP